MKLIYFKETIAFLVFGTSRSRGTLSAPNYFLHYELAHASCANNAAVTWNDFNVDITAPGNAIRLGKSSIQTKISNLSKSGVDKQFTLVSMAGIN